MSDTTDDMEALSGQAEDYLEEEERAKEFVDNLGNGKSMVEIEQDEYIGDEPDYSEMEFEITCKQYADNKKKITEFDNLVELATKELNEQIKKLSDERTKIYNELVKSDGERLHNIKDKLTTTILETFPTEEKSVTFEGVGRFSKKVLKSIEVIDKNKLLNSLVEKKMLSKGVKSFDTTFLKKGNELGLFTNEEIKEIEKSSLQFVEEKIKL